MALSGMDISGEKKGKAVSECARSEGPPLRDSPQSIHSCPALFEATD